VRHPVLPYYDFPDELLNLLYRDGGQWLGLNPFCEVVNPYTEELDLPFPKSERSQDMNPSLCKWPREEYGM